MSVAKAGLPEASAAIAIATTRQTIGSAIEAIALLGANRDWPCVLVIDSDVTPVGSVGIYIARITQGGST